MYNYFYGYDYFYNDEDVLRCIGWVFFLNFMFIIIEFIGGWLINSMVIMVDVIYDLGDSIFIGIVWGLNKFSNKFVFS